MQSTNVHIKNYYYCGVIVYYGSVSHAVPLQKNFITNVSETLVDWNAFFSIFFGPFLKRMTQWSMACEKKKESVKAASRPKPTRKHVR